MNNAHTVRRSVLTLAVAALALGGCGDDFMVPNFNNPSREDLTGSPTRATVAAAVRGVVRNHRGNKAGMVTRLGVWGREGYDLRPEEPRTTTDALIDPIDPVNGGQYFGGQYTEIAEINTVLAALENSPLNAAERSATSGFLKTFKAAALWQIAIARAEEVGIPLDPQADPQAELSPIVAKDQVWQAIFDLYDQAAAELQGGGAEFPFALPDGFTGFSTPSSFAQVNRALKARALKYQGEWSEALAALQGSFVSDAAPGDLGVYFNYSTISGDAPNGFFSNSNHYAHPRIRGEAQLQADGSLDRRALDKAEPIPAFTLFEITVSDQMDVYESLSAPLPWIRNAELLLIRAEANLALGDDGAALADVNAVREAEGGLPPLAAFPADALGEILYNKLYSLLWEGGYHYFDMRQYDRLDDLPRARPNHGVYPGFPYPLNECLAREIMNQVECTTYFAE